MIGFVRAVSFASGVAIVGVGFILMGALSARPDPDVSLVGGLANLLLAAAILTVASLVPEAP